MSISRTGACPPFLEYVTKQALIPRASQPTPQFLQLTQYNFRWIDIPSYQRGLVWDEALFEDLLSSDSVFLGNAILGSFPAQPGSGASIHLPASVQQYEILIDGLQRFSIGTALLTLLYPQVLAEQALRPGDAPHFAALKAQAASLAPIFQHNDAELQSHPRKAVCGSYADFRKILERWLRDQFDAGQAVQLGERMQRLFLVRQIAPDTYYGFTNPYQVTNTFIGLNTIRVQLSIVDWLRSVIVDRGSASGWSAAETEAVENRFTEVFTREKDMAPAAELIPLAAIVKDCLTHAEASRALAVFPSWNAGLLTEEVDRFLAFVEAMDGHTDNPFYREIRDCGAIPFAGCICHYYRQYLSVGSEPSFLSGGGVEDVELRAFLRAYYRVVFDGHVARTRAFAERLLREQVTLVEVADDLSRRFLNRDLSRPVDRDWLVSTLKQADQQRAKQVFNACLLPALGSASVFAPLRFGTKGPLYQIDHLIPDSIAVKNKPGGPETQLITNFAPIRRTANIRQLNVTCAQKLAATGTYAAECQNDPTVHPYVRWLVAHQGQHWSHLDDQRYLEPNSMPAAIGDERIAWLADWLLARL